MAHDTARHRDLHFPKSGEANLIVLPPLDTTASDTIMEMPLQGPEKTPETVVPAPTLGVVDTPKVQTLLAYPPKLQHFTPSSMLAWGEWEARYYQQIYTQSHYFDAQGKARPQGSRSSYYTGIASINLGCKPWINFGVDLWIRAVRIDDQDASPFHFFSFGPAIASRAGIAAIAPKVKIQPFKKRNGLTFQSAVLLPLARDLEGAQSGRPYLATQNLVAWTQVYFTQNIGLHGQIFAEADLYASINTGRANQHQPSSLALPISVYGSYFFTQRLTCYLMNQVWPTSNSIWYQAGVGAKYRFSEGFELELMYGRFLAGVNAAGQANALNLGARLVKW